MKALVARYGTNVETAAAALPWLNTFNTTEMSAARREPVLTETYPGVHLPVPSIPQTEPVRFAICKPCKRINQHQQLLLELAKSYWHVLTSHMH